MAAFLSDAWFRELEEIPVPPDLDARVGYAIGETRFVVTVRDGRLRVGHDEPADITVRLDRGTAADLATGRRTAHDAFLAGDVRFGGDLSRLPALTAAVTAIGGALAQLRDRTRHDVR